MLSVVPTPTASFTARTCTARRLRATARVATTTQPPAGRSVRCHHASTGVRVESKCGVQAVLVLVGHHREGLFEEVDANSHSHAHSAPPPPRPRAGLAKLPRPNIAPCRSNEINSGLGPPFKGKKGSPTACQRTTRVTGARVLRPAIVAPT